MGFLLPTKANFPFQTGPIIFSPYGSMFATTSQLNPFESNPMFSASFAGQPNPHQNLHNKPLNGLNHLPKHHHSKHSKHHYKDYMLEPLKWGKFSAATDLNGLSIKGVPKRNYKKMIMPVPKYNSLYNKAAIRPKPQTTNMNMKYQTNHFNPKSAFNYNAINYKNSNTFRKTVPQKALFGKSHSSRYPSETKAMDDTNGRQSALDIELSSDDEDYNEADYKTRIRTPNRAQYVLPPNDYQSFPSNSDNYGNKPRVLSSADSRYKRPALYEIEAPKNLNKNRPDTHTNGFMQNIPVPHKTLMEIADITGPPKPPVSPRPHPFEGFYQKSNYKSEPDIIVNSLDDKAMGGTVKQVGASMTVQMSEDRRVLPKGKIFDEPLSDADRRYENSYRKPLNDNSNDNSYSHKPFRPNDKNPFNSKHFDTFPIDKSNKVDSNYNNNKQMNDNSFMAESEAKSDYDYNDSREDGNDYPKLNQNTNNNYKDDESDNRPNSEPFTDNRPESGETSSEDKDSGKSSDDNFDEWTSNGIPGEPGKDYPMLSAAPAKSDFACVGRPHGFYADVSQKCQVYHQCGAHGHQRFLCPNGTLYNQESLVCEWWYNVNCDQSEKLYHKNSQLYDNDSQQNDESTEKGLDNEDSAEDRPARNYHSNDYDNNDNSHRHPSNNYHKSNGNNYHKNNANNDHNHQHHLHHRSHRRNNYHNNNLRKHSPHSHNHSHHRRQPSSSVSSSSGYPRDTRYRSKPNKYANSRRPYDSRQTADDDDIDVDLMSDDETRPKPSKSPATLPLVSYLNQMHNKGVNRHFVLLS